LLDFKNSLPTRVKRGDRITSRNKKPSLPEQKQKSDTSTAIAPDSIQSDDRNDLKPFANSRQVERGSKYETFNPLCNSVTNSVQTDLKLGCPTSEIA